MKERTRQKVCLILGISCLALAAILLVLTLESFINAPDELGYAWTFLVCAIILALVGAVSLFRFFWVKNKLRRLQNAADDLAVLTDVTVLLGTMVLHYMYTDKYGITRTNIINSPIQPKDKETVKTLTHIPIRHNGKLSVLREDMLFDMVEKARARSQENSKIADIDLQNYEVCPNCAGQIKFDNNGTGICAHCDNAFVR